MIKVTITGTNAILLHKYTVNTVSEPKGRGIKGRDSANYSDEWIKATYLNDDGNLILPALNLIACIFDGARQYKIGKKASTRIVATALKVFPQEPLLKVSGKLITIDDIRKNPLWLHTTGAVISGRRVDRVRTMLPKGWTVDFEIDYDNEALALDDVRNILEIAGSRAGLGDWRPSAPKKPGPYGTFEITKFEE